MSTAAEMTPSTFHFSDSELLCIAGLNVLEDVGLALEVASELRSVTAALGLPFVFKASFDKANRSTASSYRGPGLKEGLRILAAVKSQIDVPIVTDIHEVVQVEAVAGIADMVQIPAFLCRQTDLLTAAGTMVGRHGGWVHVKKGQFLAPWDCRHIIDKVNVAAGRPATIICERGTSFGYNNLVVDMLGLLELHALGAPVTFDATHACQLPGADPARARASTGGRRAGVPALARGAVATGVDGIFLEFHPAPDAAKCDAGSCLPLSQAAGLLAELKAVRSAVAVAGASTVRQAA